MTDADAAFSEAFACLEQGLVDDEDGRRTAALEMYERGVNLLREAEAFHDTDALVTSELYAHLKQAENSVQHRIDAMKRAGTLDAEVQGANEAMAKLDIRDQLEAVGAAEAELILCIPDGVQLFQIDAASSTTPTYPSSLSIFKFPAGSSENEATSSAEFHTSNPDAFIQVGPWTYPLYKGVTPVLCNEFGAYIVSNPTEEMPNLSVAIMLPSDLDPNLRRDFEKLLNEFAVVRRESGAESLSHEEKKRVSERISAYIVLGSEKVAWVVQSASAKTASLVHSRSEKYREGKQPPERPVGVAHPVRNGAVYLHKGSKVVAKCTRFLLDKIGDIGVAVGRQVASGSKSVFGEGKAGGLVSGTITVIGGGITGASTIWIALEEASKTLCRSIADSTVEVVKVKYGEEMSETTRHSLYAAGHSTLAAAQLWDLGPRSVAGRMARKAGIQFVRDLDATKAAEKKKPLPDENEDDSQKKKQ